MADMDRRIDFNNDHAVITCGSENLICHARLFAQNSWVAIPYQDGDVSDIPGLWRQSDPVRVRAISPLR